MSDGYELYCIEKLRNAPPFGANPYEADEVQCACADYLRTEGYGDLSNNITSKRVMASAAQLIPTTTNAF